MASNDHDPLDEVLRLEETFYQEGYRQGVQDGERAGLVEGRSVGIKAGFEKFKTMSRLHARSQLWAGSLSPENPQVDSKTRPHEQARLLSRLQTIYALTEPASLSTRNDEADVADFDSRLRRAEGKFKVVELNLGKATRSKENQQISDPTTRTDAISM